MTRPSKKSLTRFRKSAMRVNEMTKKTIEQLEKDCKLLKLAIGEFKTENKELKKELEDKFELNDELYGIEMVTTKEGQCHMTSENLAICKNLKTACLIKTILERGLPDGFHSECGDDKISREVQFRVDALFKDDVRSFVEKEGF